MPSTMRQVFNGHTDLGQGTDFSWRGGHRAFAAETARLLLMLAAREGREDAARPLLESGADTGSEK